MVLISQVGITLSRYWSIAFWGVPSELNYGTLCFDKLCENTADVIISYGCNKVASLLFGLFGSIASGVSINLVLGSWLTSNL